MDEALEELGKMRQAFHNFLGMTGGVLETQKVEGMPVEYLPMLILSCELLLLNDMKAVPDVKLLQEVAKRRFEREGNSSMVPPKPGDKEKKKESTTTTAAPPVKTVVGEDCPPRPDGMVPTEEVTKAMKSRQWDDPRKWTMTFAQWENVLEHSINTEAYKTLKKTKRKVTMYDLNEFFVKPWTKNTGCGLATLMNRDEPPEATLMLSHAWAEDVEECKAAMNRWFYNTLQKEHQGATKDDVWVWFCVFANFQCEDGSGPSIPDQLAKDPFEAVITSEGVKGHGMCAIHTTQADLYSRLWCVLEIAAAKEEDLVVTSAMSTEYVENAVRRMKLIFEHEQGFDHDVCLKAAGVMCDTVKAQCGCASDEAMLIDKIIHVHKEFSRLDEVVKKFRIDTLPEEVKRMARISKFRTKKEHEFRDAAADLAQTAQDERTKELLDAFYARVEDEDPFFRRVALQELKSVAERGDPRAIEAAMKHVTDKDGQVVAAALEALQGLARSGDMTVVAATVQRLEKLRCSQGHVLQLRRVPPDCGCSLCQDPCVRLAAMHLLGALAERGDEKAISLTLQYLEDQDIRVRSAVLGCLKTLSHIGDAEVVASVCKLLDSEKDRSVVFKILEAVEVLAGDSGESGTAELLQHVEHKDADIRKQVLATLKSVASRGDTNAIERLSECLGKEQDASVIEVIIDVLEALAKQGDESAISALLLTLEYKGQKHDGQGDYTVRTATVAALKSLVNKGDEKVCISLLQLLEHGDDHVRDAAAEALKSVVRVGDEEMCRRLLARFEHSDARVRNKAMHALQSLAHKGDAAVCGALLKLLEHKDGSICVLAGDAFKVLANNGDAQVKNSLLHLIQHSDNVWTSYGALAALETVAEQGDEEVTSAIQMCLQDQVGMVREAAEKALRALQ